ncbi:hypothetical protein BaRGS_00032989 [Batillaria attramentaria]|uniref:Uncharacterized protein n=1 Tax=Batillaria attramentaria TaxID=370345 RepID=A0ABD0JM19_9CAEN
MQSLEALKFVQLSERAADGERNGFYRHKLLLRNEDSKAFCEYMDHDWIEARQDKYTDGTIAPCFTYFPTYLDTVILLS